jgi:HSP20 family molecular chaperone IbpA
MIVKTELANVEENDGSIRKAIERRAYELYELDGFKDGSDREHWFRAEKELTIQDAACSVEDDEVTVRLPMEGFSASTVLVSISARSALILSLEDESSNHPGGTHSDFLRVVSLPVEVDAMRVTCEFDGGDLVLTFPAVRDVPIFARTACAYSKYYLI